LHTPPSELATLSLHDALPILGLALGEGELLHQPGAGFRRGAGAPDQRDHRIDVIQGDAQALQDVGPGLRLVQFVAGAADDDVLLDRKSTRLNSSHVKISYAVF